VPHRRESNGSSRTDTGYFSRRRYQLRSIAPRRNSPTKIQRLLRSGQLATLSTPVRGANRATHVGPTTYWYGDMCPEVLPSLEARYNANALLYEVDMHRLFQHPSLTVT
jgi:hypothetical protein